jgi:hypothetical protein
MYPRLCLVRPPFQWPLEAPASVRQAEHMAA